MRIYTHDDPDAMKILQSISSKIQTLQDNEIPFFLLVHDEYPKGMVAIRNEPCFFIANSGSLLGEVVCFGEDIEEFEEILKMAIQIQKQEGLTYLIHSRKEFSREEKELLETMSFELIDHSYMMGIEVKGYYEVPEGLILKPITVDGRRDFLDKEKQFYEGTGDTSTEFMMDMIRNLPMDELDTIYNEDTSYYVMDGESIIAILVIFIDRGGIASIAVKPNLRRKGYGKKIIYMALNRLKEFGWSKIMLRVHAKNEAAIQLYRSIGFDIIVERKAYVRLAKGVK